MSSSFLTTEKSSFLFLSFKFEYKENGETHTYAFKTGLVPNMIAKIWMANNRKEGFKVIGFVANKDIRKGAELTINYGYNYDP
ncbi:hypothetical protein L3Y34_017432 [Caenorhabditis briggsae]|uniref:SET domain-containing protein n=1 Tax=Caenorhabditis briggsae TaxID=6238 RepID=A0AAE9DJD0_CAEBR|nr:hypothetical protein L3Y34_017432 [Caenorhabditis briggsae]